MYALPVCSSPGDASSGLKGPGSKLPCSVASTQATLEFSSPIIKAMAVSCSPCKKVNKLKKSVCYLPFYPLVVNNATTPSPICGAGNAVATTVSPRSDKGG